MKYEIGQKVETPLGVGTITYLGKFTSSLETSYHVNIKGHELMFEEKELKPYPTPHEKLIELGYELFQTINWKTYRHDTLPNIKVDDDNTISCYDIDLKLARIITEYLEWLEEAK